MDVLFFLKERTKFIRYFYETAGEPFRETIRKIEADEAPFDDPPYSEDGEPPFLEEWTEADEEKYWMNRYRRLVRGGPNRWTAWRRMGSTSG